MFYVYILRSLKDDSFYVGMSADPLGRLAKHNRKHRGYTARKQPWILVYEEMLESKEDALKRESEIKKQKSRQYIIDLIASGSVG